MARSKKPKKPATSFKPAPAAEAMAGPIISAHHPHLRECDVRIEFIFRSDTAKSKGKLVAAKASKVTSLAAFFGREPEQEFVKPFFAIVISEPQWCHFNEAQRNALLDHELCHLTARRDNDGNVVLGTQGHDLEEFTAIVERHGLWLPDVKRMAKAMETAPQVAMDLSGASEETRAIYAPIVEAVERIGAEGVEIIVGGVSMSEPDDAEGIRRAALHTLSRIGVPTEEEAATKAALDNLAEMGLSGIEIEYDGKPVEEIIRSKWVDCPDCKGLAKRRGYRATCGCGWTAAFKDGAWQPTT